MSPFLYRRDNATATKESYLHLIESRFKPYFSKIAIKDLNKGLIQKFIDQHTTAIKETPLLYYGRRCENYTV
ncbi:MAG: hypothetical protein ACLUPK_05550 [Veillonella sp.]